MGKLFKGCLVTLGGLVLIAIIIGIIIAATGGGGGESSSGGESSEGSSDNGESSSEEQTYSMGDEAQVGEVTYVINDMETSESAGIEGAESEASGLFIVLDVEVTNNGSEAVTMDSSYISLLSGGNTYDADGANSDLFLEQVNPDSTVSGEVVFDVNEDVAEADDLQAQLNEGIFGSNSATVNLSE